MKSLERYAKNLELFVRDNLLQSLNVEEGAYSSLRFCKTHEGELNLVDESQQPPLYLHAQAGALWEAEYWASKLQLADYQVIFVYGVGLGYYFLPLKKWLLENSEHYLVFLEDDEKVIYYFLKTELATEILEHPQVLVKFLPRMEPNEEGWAELRAKAASLFWDFAQLKPQMSALQSYFISKGSFFKSFALQWLTNLSRAERSLAEFYPFPELVTHNFYANLPYMAYTIPGYRLAGAMKAIPAILCGAGPSLHKQLPLLKTLSERAFIIASGSAMNAITRSSMMPHVGGAIDPTSAQASRQLTSFAYHTPVFYQNRFHDQAFIQWHGPLLFMVGSGSNRLSEWFEKELGIIGAEQIIMGVSTSNFLAEIANFLGCNPIVLIGMDLAYTRDSRYVQGIEAHPSDDEIQHQSLNQKQEVLIPVPGVDGKDVYITNQWFYEAVCLAAFKQRNPDLVLLNATEGGMAIPTVDYAVFAEVVRQYCSFSWDIQGWFHGAIQNASRFQISLSRILEAIKKWRKSLDSCRDSFSLLISHFQTLLKSSHQQKGSFALYSESAALWQQEFQREICYEFLLEDLNTLFERLNGLKIRKLKWIKNKHQLRSASIAIEVARYHFLKEYVEGHIKSIDEGLKAFEDRQKVLLDKVEQQERLKSNLEIPEYRINDDTLSFQEPRLGLSLTASFASQAVPKHSWPKPGQQPLVDVLISKFNDKNEGQTLYFYPNGKIKAEAFFKAGKLQGPWSFYSEEGRVLYRSWFVEDIRQGVAVAYYLTGELYSVQGYCHGLATGYHDYYFQDGTLKTREMYKSGKLDGIVRLYYSNGRMKKEQHFFDGELNGIERIWDERGTLIIEASYELGKVVGISRRWHPNGQLARRVEHTKHGDQWEEWDEHGVKLKQCVS